MHRSRILMSRAAAAHRYTVLPLRNAPPQWSAPPMFNQSPFITSRHASSLLGKIGNWLEALQDRRGVMDSRTLVGEDELGNKYFVKKPMSGMVAESSHIKEIRSIEYAGGNRWREYDPDSVPVEWRIWLAGQQRLPPNLVPVSGANSTLDRLEDVPIEEMHRGDAGASVAPMKAAVLGNLQASSGTGYRAYNPAKKKYEPESWSERDGGGVRKDNTNSQPQKK